MPAVTLRAMAVASAPGGRAWNIGTETEGNNALTLKRDTAKFNVAFRRASSLRCQAVENTPSAVRDSVKKDTINGRPEQSPPQSDQEAALATTADGAPVTFERRLPTDLDFEKPYLARALKAVDREHPYGTEGYPASEGNNNRTVLQQHVDFFDTDKDGKIFPWDTYSGFRRIGFNPILSGAAGVIINGAFAFSTSPGWLPHPLFAIYTNKIHKAKHGSDSEVYDTEGRFVPSKFEEIFSKYAKTHPDRLSLSELNALTEGQRNTFDGFGSFASKLEWYITYLLLKDDEDFCSKESIRGMYDGSIFVQKEKETAKKKGGR